MRKDQNKNMLRNAANKEEEKKKNNSNIQDFL